MGVAEPEPAAQDRAPRESVEALFVALESPLLAYAFRLVPDAEVAEEIVQEAFMRLHAQFSQVREPRRWLYRTVHNLALNRRRGAARIVPLDAGQDHGGEARPPQEPVDPKPLPDEELARHERIGFVRAAVQNLDGRSRELVLLKFNGGLSYKEISARTGLTVGHVGYLLHHALRSVAADLAKAGFVP